MLALILAASGLASAAEPMPQTVTLVIDYGDGVEKRFSELPWKPEATVLDAIRAAEQHPRGSRFVYRGSGATAFLTQIDDVKNEGAGRNWIFSINDVAGKQSFAVSPIKAGDCVRWKFTEYK